MSIQEVGERIKGVASSERYVFSALLILVASASFALGRLSGDDSIVPISWGSEASALVPGVPLSRVSNEVSTTSMEVAVTNATSTIVKEEGVYVASRKGTKYHLPWCSGARTISEENKLWFGSKAEAEAAGYAPAKNCKGL